MSTPPRNPHAYWHSGVFFVSSGFAGYHRQERRGVLADELRLRRQAEDFGSGGVSGPIPCQGPAETGQARQLLAEGIDPNTAKREEKFAKVAAAGNSFKAVALEWQAMKAKSSGAATTSAKRLTQMQNHIFPAIGSRPVADVKPAEVLALMQAVAAKGITYTAGRLRELCGQVFRYAIQTGRATYDPAASMRGAIEKPSVNHRPALTTRREFGDSCAT